MQNKNGLIYYLRGFNKYGSLAILFNLVLLSFSMTFNISIELTFSIALTILFLCAIRELVVNHEFSKKTAIIVVAIVSLIILGLSGSSFMKDESYFDVTDFTKFETENKFEF